MKKEEYYRLAEINLRSRKKSVGNTVRGIVFSLILLVPVLFTLLGFYGGVNGQVNKNPELLYAAIDTSAPRSNMQDFVFDETSFYNGAVSGAHIKDLIDGIGIGEKICYEQLFTRYNYLDCTTSSQLNKNVGVFEFGTGGGELSVMYQGKAPIEGRTSNYFAAILDTGITGNAGFIPETVKKRFGDVLIEGLDKGFTGNGKGQVILSELFIKSLNLNPYDVYGKTVTVRYGIKTPEWSFDDFKKYLDTDNNPGNDNYDSITATGYEKKVYLCYEYEVVGVIKKKVTEFAIQNSVNDYRQTGNIAANMMFFTKASQVTEDGKYLEPVITKHLFTESENYTGGEMCKFMGTYVYNDEDFERLNKEYICTGLYDFNSLKTVSAESGEYIFPQSTLYLSASNYAELDRALKKAVQIINGSSAVLQKDVLVENYSGTVFKNLYTVYKASSYVMLFLGAAGGIIFFAAMVNMFNSISYSVESRRRYLGIMKAMGAKSADIPRLYLAEALTVFKRAAAWVLIFSVLLCLIIKYILDFFMNEITQMKILPIELSVSWFYIPLTLVIVSAALILFGFLFSYGCSLKVSKSRITALLYG